MADEKSSYIAVFAEPMSAELKGLVETNIAPADRYQISETGLLVRGFYESTKVLRELLEISGDTHTGVVLRLNGSYSGYFNESLWTWLMEGRHE